MAHGSLQDYLHSASKATGWVPLSRAQKLHIIEDVALGLACVRDHRVFFVVFVSSLNSFHSHTRTRSLTTEDELLLDGCACDRNGSPRIMPITAIAHTPFHGRTMESFNWSAEGKKPALQNTLPARSEVPKFREGRFLFGAPATTTATTTITITMMMMVRRRRRRRRIMVMMMMTMRMMMTMITMMMMMIMMMTTMMMMVIKMMLT
jgi:hypothetical protein